MQENISKITCVLKWGRNLQADLLRQESQMLEKLKNMELSKVPEGYQLFEENEGVYFLREYIEGIPLDEKRRPERIGASGNCCQNM